MNKYEYLNTWGCELYAVIFLVVLVICITITVVALAILDPAFLY